MSKIESFSYDNKTVKWFAYATIIWGLVGMLVGVWAAFQMVFPALNFSTAEISFGRIRPLHTNAVIFAFVGNGIFMGVYHSMQRLLKTRMFSDALSKFHFWGWQAIILAAALTLPLGLTSSHEYAELEWPIDIAIALVWIAFGINMFGTILRRRENHLYVAIWFYIATWVTVTVLHVFNNLSIPYSIMGSIPVLAGVQDALVQWWYGHNAVAFFLTTPYLGLMYYYLPKAANRPIFSYKLSIIHFWALIFIYIWAGPHHLLHTSLPDWAQTLGVTFSIMLWAPSWGGMINGLLTLRGAWDKVRDSAVLKFFVVAVTFYGMSTFEGPLLSLREVNALSHNTDWTIGHVHSGALGWVAMITIGSMYHLIPSLFGRKPGDMYSIRLINLHFWMATLGTVLYIASMWVNGLLQGLMWRATSVDGTLTYSFVESVEASYPAYYVRFIGGAIFFVGMLIMAYNVWKTIRGASR